MNNNPLGFFYRPHPQDGEGTVFTGVYLSTGGGGSALSCSVAYA